MSDKMDIDLPGSAAPRDPRLANRQSRPPPSASAPSKAAKPPRPTAQRPNQRGEEIAQSLQGLTDLVRTSVEKERKSLERGKLLKKKEKTDGLLKRARANAGFPATIEQFQQTNEDEINELKRLDEDIRKDQSGCSQLEKTLKSSLLSVFSLDPASPEERIAKLEKGFEEKLSKQQNEFDRKLTQYRNELEGRMNREFDQAKTAAADAEKRATQASTLNQTLTGSVSKFQDRVEALEKSAAKHSSADRKSPSLPESQALGVDQLRTDIEDLKQQVGKLEPDVKQLALFKPHCLEMFDGLNKGCAKQQDVEDLKTSAVEPLKMRIIDFNTRLESLNSQNTRPVQIGAEAGTKLDDMGQRLHKLEENHATLQAANLDVSSLSENLGQIQAVQEMQDDFQKSEFEDVRKSLGEQAEELQALKDDYTRAVGEQSKEFKSWKDAHSHALGQQAEEFKLFKDAHNHILGELEKIKKTDSTLTQKLAELGSTVAAAQNNLETVMAGFYSLETRYNSLSTEPMVKNMVATMQEMYPSTGQFAEQLATLRTDSSRAIQELRERAGRLFSAQHDQSQQFQHLSLRMNEVDGIKQGFFHLRQSFGELQNNVRNQNMEHIQVKLDELGKRLDEDEGKVEQLRLQGTSDTEALHKLEHERGGLKEDIEKLKRQATNFVDEIDETKAANAANIDQIRAQEREIKAFKERVAQAEESAQTGDIECRMQILENSTSENGRELREEINLLKKAAASRSSSLQREHHSKPSSPRPHPSGTVDPQHAENNPGEALQEIKKKKKRPRPSNATDDGVSARGSNSPATFGMDPAAPGEPGEKKKKKKKKLKLQEDTENVQ